MTAPVKIRRRNLYRTAVSESVRADEIMTTTELRKRLRWGRKSLDAARKAGLRVLNYGRLTYALGADVLAFFSAVAARQAGQDKQMEHTTTTEGERC